MEKINFVKKYSFWIIWLFVVIVIGVFAVALSDSLLEVLACVLTKHITIFLLIAFFPITVFSFHRFHLPKKNEDYHKLVCLLGLNPNEKATGVDASCSSGGDGYHENALKIFDDYKITYYFLPVLFVSLFSFLAFSSLFDNDGSALFVIPAIEQIDGRHASASLSGILMAFLGAYVWSVRYIFRRLVTVDLPPGAYYHVAVRMVFTSFLGLAIYKLLYVISSLEGLGGLH